MKSKQNTKRPCGARQSRENSKPSQHIKVSNVSTSFRLGFDNVDYVFKDCLHIKVTEASHTVCLLTRCSAQGTIAFGTHSFLLQAWQGNISYFLPSVGMAGGGFVQILEQKGSHIICELHRTCRIKKILFKVHTHTVHDWASFNLQALQIVKNIFSLLPVEF